MRNCWRVYCTVGITIIANVMIIIMTKAVMTVMNELMTIMMNDA
jgi:hypothetical protein